MSIRVICCVIPSLLLVIACTQAGTTTPTSRPTSTLFSTPTPVREINVTPLKPGESPWQILTPFGSPVKLLASHPTQAGWIYALIAEESVLIVSNSGGRSWQTGDLSRIDLIKVALTNPMMVYAIAENRASVWKSSNGGLNFKQLKSPLGEHFALAILPSDANVIYLVGGPGKGDLPAGRELYRSRDGGETWGFLTHLPSNMGLKGELLIDPTNEAHFYATLWERSVWESKAYESWDGGRTWREVESLKFLTPMKWILTKGLSPTAYMAVRAERVDSPVPSYVAAKPKSVKFPLVRGPAVAVFPDERFPEFGEFMVLDAMFNNPEVVIGRYMGGTYGGAILLTQDGGKTWLRLDTAGWKAGDFLYPMALVKDLAVASTDPLRVFAGVHWPPELQGLWMLELHIPLSEYR